MQQNEIRSKKNQNQSEINVMKVQIHNQVPTHKLNFFFQKHEVTILPVISVARLKIKEFPKNNLKNFQRSTFIKFKWFKLLRPTVLHYAE